MTESIGRRLMKTWVLKGSSWKSQPILCTRCLWRIRSLMLPPLLADWEYHKVCLPNTWVAPRNLPQNEWKLYLRPYVLWVENYAPFLWLDVSNKILCKRDSTRFRAFFGVCSAWVLANGCKSLMSPNSGNHTAQSKGVHRELESERSLRQTSGLTDRNFI